MRISATVHNDPGSHEASVSTGPATRTLSIPAKNSGRGSGVNGGEMLMLALATCYCNDIFREAGKRGIEVESVDVAAHGDFEGEGLPASKIE